MAHIKLLQHFSIYCRDLEPMHDFYVNTLGLPELPRPEFPFPGYWLETGAGHHIHLSKLRDGHVTKSISENEDTYMDHHFGLLTDNLQGMKERLASGGFPSTTSPTDIRRYFSAIPKTTLSKSHRRKCSRKNRKIYRKERSS